MTVIIPHYHHLTPNFIRYNNTFVWIQQHCWFSVSAGGNLWECRRIKRRDRATGVRTLWHTARRSSALGRLKKHSDTSHHPEHLRLIADSKVLLWNQQQSCWQMMRTFHIYRNTFAGVKWCRCIILWMVRNALIELSVYVRVCVRA